MPTAECEEPNTIDECNAELTRSINTPSKDRYEDFEKAFLRKRLRFLSGNGAQYANDEEITHRGAFIDMLSQLHQEKEEKIGKDPKFAKAIWRFF